MVNDQFKVGDVIISSKGTKPARITHTITWWEYYEVKYLHNNHSGAISKLNAILYNGEPTMTQDALYSFTKDDGSIGYATYLATDSAGKWVVEERETNKIHTKPKDSFTEVVPYTFSTKCENSSHDFTCEEGKVEIGDVLMKDGKIHQVTQLNTKKRNAPTFNGVRFETAPF